MATAQQPQHKEPDMAARIAIQHVAPGETLDYLGRCPEEGHERYCRAWQAVADTVDGRQFAHPHAFHDQDAADAFVARVAAAGTLDPDCWWETTTDPNAVPDWATPEFAWRERQGLPL